MADDTIRAASYELILDFLARHGRLPAPDKIADQLEDRINPTNLRRLRKLILELISVAMSNNPSATPPEIEQQARYHLERMALNLHVLHARAERDFDTVFARLPQLRADALLITGDALFRAQSTRLAALAIRNAVPSIFQYREFAAAGGLMSYGGNITDMYRLVGTYAGRILNGEKPGDLPIQQSSKVELIINLRTAKALGVTVPPTLLARADEVIE